MRSVVSLFCVLACRLATVNLGVSVSWSVLRFHLLRDSRRDFDGGFGSLRRDGQPSLRVPGPENQPPKRTCYSQSMCGIERRPPHAEDDRRAGPNTSTAGLNKRVPPPAAPLLLPRSGKPLLAAPARQLPTSSRHPVRTAGSSFSVRGSAVPTSSSSGSFWSTHNGVIYVSRCGRTCFPVATKLDGEKNLIK